MENAPGNLFVTIKPKQSSKRELGSLRDCGKCCYLWERQGLKYSLCSRFNLGSAIGNRNNCVLATGGFLQGGVPYAETHFFYCKWFSSQTLLFPKATFPGLSCVLSFSPSLPFSCFRLFSSPLSFTALLRDNLCTLPGSFICQYLVEARGGHQMKNINHTGELQGDLGEKKEQESEREEWKKE